MAGDQKRSRRRRTAEEVIDPINGLPRLVVVRSTARTKTISAQPQDDGSVRLLVPAALTCAQVLAYAEQLVPKVEAKRAMSEQKKEHSATDSYLLERAELLAQRYLPELGSTTDLHIRWVTNQGKRWGSCTPSQSSIRISHVLQGAPEYVLDYVIHHELCHLLEHAHNKHFKTLEARYPQMDRAEAFLDGIIFGQNR